jgi:hypothetical protein
LSQQQQQQSDSTQQDGSGRRAFSGIEIVPVLQEESAEFANTPERATPSTAIPRAVLSENSTPSLQHFGHPSGAYSGSSIASPVLLHGMRTVPDSERDCQGPNASLLIPSPQRAEGSPQSPEVRDLDVEAQNWPHEG